MHQAELGRLEYMRALAERLGKSPHGCRSQMIQEAAAFLGCSNARVYRELRRVGWRSGRKLREDKGDTRLSGEELQRVANLMYQSSRQTGKRLLSARDAIEILTANGELSADVSPATALRILRLHGMHPEQLARPTPHTPLASLHPNHVWQFDVSLCVLFYLRSGGIGVMDEKTFYKNKPRNVERIADKRVWRYLVTDHYSGAFFLQYYQAAGENQENLFNFLMDAFFPRAHPQDPFHGVPFRMVWDAGSANQSYLIRNLLDQLGVEHYAHIPGNPRAKGQVEVTHNIIERGFESRLYIYRPESIVDLNEHAHIWMRSFNGMREHTRHGHTRYGLWQTIRREQLRQPKSREICEALLHTKPEPRQVRGHLVVSYAIKGYGQQDYKVGHIPDIRVGENVLVCVNPYRAPNVNVIAMDREGRERWYECEPVQKNTAGFSVDAPVIGERYAAAPDTATDLARKEMTQRAYGAATLDAAERARDANAPAFAGIDPISYLDKQQSAYYLRRPGTDLDLPDRARPESERMTRTIALIRLHKRGHILTDAERAAFDAWIASYPGGVTTDDLDTWLAQLGSRDAAIGA